MNINSKMSFILSGGPSLLPAGGPLHGLTDGVPNHYGVNGGDMEYQMG